MCKVVYLTAKRFDKPANEFKNLLAEELRKRKVEVETGYAFDIFNYFRKHKTYGIAIAIDFFRDNGTGSGLKLNKRCSSIARDFAYNLSDSLDVLTPTIPWRELEYVDSYDADWYKFYNKVSSTTKVILYLCTITNANDYDSFLTVRDKVISSFVDEIIRCLRSNYNWELYIKRKRLLKKNSNKKTLI